jgi:hypothetical protein
MLLGELRDHLRHLIGLIWLQVRALLQDGYQLVHQLFLHSPSPSHFRPRRTGTAAIMRNATTCSTSCVARR